VKIGMLATADVIDAVAAVLTARRPPFVVLDPVMAAKSGDRLLAADAVAHLRGVLLPVVDLVTPNLPEAADLVDGAEAVDEAQMADQARALAALGPAVLLKGGHLGGAESPDLFLDNASVEPVRLAAPRVVTKNDHGTGCTLSSAIAVLRPRHDAWLPAVRAAKAYLSEALVASDRLEVGSGHGPVHHFHAWW
jgi:hydroxymethylpyrimidine/phosphomethylpyrimidine kinase